MTEAVTGARTEITLLVDLPRQRVWDLATDVERYGEWSPECVYAGWLDAAAHRTPRAGDRFAGRNRFPNGFQTSVVCLVTEVVRHESFEWAVLDDDGLHASIWRYDLADADRPGRTRLRHGFVHGPGATMTRITAPEDPAGVERRLAELRQNMLVSLAAMLSGETYEEVAL